MKSSTAQIRSSQWWQIVAILSSINFVTTGIAALFIPTVDNLSQLLSLTGSFTSIHFPFGRDFKQEKTPKEKESIYPVTSLPRSDLDRSDLDHISTPPKSGRVQIHSPLHQSSSSAQIRFQQVIRSVKADLPLSLASLPLTSDRGVDLLVHPLPSIISTPKVLRTHKIKKTSKSPRLSSSISHHHLQDRQRSRADRPPAFDLPLSSLETIKIATNLSPSPSVQIAAKSLPKSIPSAHDLVPHPINVTPLIKLAAVENLSDRIPSIPRSHPPQSLQSLQVSYGILDYLRPDFRYDWDKWGKNNQMVEETASFPLENGDRLQIKTGINYFGQPKNNRVTNIPIQVSWETQIDGIKVKPTAGIDIFDTRSITPNFGLKVDLPPMSGINLSAELEAGTLKANATTIQNQISSWRFGPTLYWQIDQDTMFLSVYRVGNYSDGNYEQQSFNRLERKFGQFSIAANLFLWDYHKQTNRGYFTPPDFLSYTGEIAWEGGINDFLRCRLSLPIGEQRSYGSFVNANNYQGRCNVNFSY